MDIGEKIAGVFEWYDNIGDFEIRVPAVRINGKKYSWEQFGCMLECYEG